MSDQQLDLEDEQQNPQVQEIPQAAELTRCQIRKRQLVSLEEGIRKMTGLTASILNLPDRGLIKKGYKADLVIFDPETIRDNSTYEQAYQYPDGID